MFTITPSDQEGIVIHDDALNQTLHLTDFAEVAALHQQLGEWLECRRAEGYLSTGEAIAIAAASGYALPITTLNSACSRGQIPNARKRRKRWQLPQTGFTEWFQQWKAVQDRRMETQQ